MTTTKKKPRIKYLSLADQLRTQVLEGSLAPGQKLPTFAQLKSEYGLGQTTLEKTYSILEAERLIVRLPGRGTFVAEPRSREVHHVIVLVEGGAEPALLSRHPYFAELLQGIRLAAKSYGYRLMLLDWETACDWDKVDGALLLDEYTEVERPVPASLPRVSLLHPIGDAPHVLVNDAEGQRGLTEYLLSLGHQRIAFVTHGHVDSVSKNRLEAYRDALRTAGIAPDPAWVRSLRGIWSPQLPAQELGKLQMRRWLASDWDVLGCTALMMQNDEAAIGALEALREAGKRVPEDVSVVGFDGTEIADYASPRLTTMRVPLREIGVRGVDLLVAQITGTPLPSGSGTGIANLLPAELRVGGSTAACALK